MLEVNTVLKILWSERKIAPIGKIVYSAEAGVCGCRVDANNNFDLFLDSTKSHFIRCISILLCSIRVKDFNITNEWLSFDIKS